MSSSDYVYSIVLGIATILGLYTAYDALKQQKPRINVLAGLVIAVISPLVVVTIWSPQYHRIIYTSLFAAGFVYGSFSLYQGVCQQKPFRITLEAATLCLGATFGILRFWLFPENLPLLFAIKICLWAWWFLLMDRDNRRRKAEEAAAAPATHLP